MTTTLRPVNTEAPVGLPQTVARTVMSLGGSRWRLVGVDGIEDDVEIRAERCWVVGEYEVDDLAGGAWEAARRRLPETGRTKRILVPGERTVRVRAERRRPVASELSDRIMRVLDDLRGAPAPASAERGVDLPALARETGWNVHERDAGRVAIDLAGPGPFFQADLGGTEAPIAAVTLTTWDAPATETAREALGFFLLGSSALVRLARGFAIDDDGGIRAGYEVPLGPAPTPETLEDALLALSSAAGRWSRELDALRDERVAAAFLVARGHAGAASRESDS